jgi:hypothetical protein
MSDARPRFPDGPYLSAAFLCERLLEEKDNVKSAIRIVDRIVRTATGPTPPQEMEPFDHELTLFVSFKSGWARGPFELRITGVKPSGDSTPLHQGMLHFEGEEDRGVELAARMMMRINQTGIHWFEVDLDGTRVSRIPLRVIYNPVRRSGGAG